MNFSARAGVLTPRVLLVSVLSVFALFGLALEPNRANAAPTISIVSGPGEGSFSQGRNVFFSMQANVPVSNPVDFGCSLNTMSLFSCDDILYPSCTPQGATKSCTQSITYSLLSEGSHVFRTAAMDCTSPCDLFDDGQIGPVVTRSFTVDRTPPVISLASGPTVSQPVTRGKPTFAFLANEPVMYSCSKDGAAPVPCGSPTTLNGVSNGRHTLSVTGTDRAGNAAPPMVLSYKVDVFKPKRCKKGKTAKAKSKYKKCVKANAKAKAKWRARNT